MEQLNGVNILKWRTAGCLYCHDLGNIERVINMLALQSVPDMPAFFKGYMNYMGESIPVVDFAQMFNPEINTRYDLDTPIIILSMRSQKAAIIVDRVVGVECVSEDAFESVKESEHDWFLANVCVEEGRALSINIESLFSVYNQPKVG